MNIAAGLSTFRRVVGKNKRMTVALRATRALVHFGPWRHLARGTIRLARPPLRADLSHSATFFPDIDPSDVVTKLKVDAMCHAGMVSSDAVARIRAVTDDLPRGEYALFNEHCEPVRELVEDQRVLTVARRYFGAEPVLLECTVVVQDAEGELRRVSAQRRFHFDYAGWQSLNLFVYLTDVPADSGAHQIAIGTHRGKRLRDLVRPAIDDDEAFERFGDRIQTIAGAAGSAFFENTEAFHRRLEVKSRRVMLNALFASHRGVMSQGRLARPYGEFIRARAEKGKSTSSRP